MDDIGLNLALTLLFLANIGKPDDLPHDIVPLSNAKSITVLAVVRM